MICGIKRSTHRVLPSELCLLAGFSTSFAKLLSWLLLLGILLGLSFIFFRRSGLNFRGSFRILVGLSFRPLAGLLVWLFLTGLDFLLTGLWRLLLIGLCLRLRTGLCLRLLTGLVLGLGLRLGFGLGRRFGLGLGLGLRSLLLLPGSKLFWLWCLGLGLRYCLSCLVLTSSFGWRSEMMSG